MEKAHLTNSFCIRLIVDEYGEIASMWFHGFDDDEKIKEIISNSKIDDFNTVIDNQKFLTATVYPDNKIIKMIMAEQENEFNKHKALSLSESELFNLNQCDFYDAWNDSEIDIIFIDFPDKNS